MHINQLKETRFLKKEDVDRPVLVTIKGDVSQENIAKEGADPELKFILHFEELEKPMVLNSTNAQLIARAVGSEDTEAWDGKQIVLFHDPNVSFGGKLVGGIRVRAPKQPPAAAPLTRLPRTSPVPVAPVEDESEIPF